MKLWPVETIDIEVARPPHDVAKALSDFVRGTNLRESLSYRKLYGTVAANGFIVSDRLRASRGPHYKFHGQLMPENDGTRVNITLKDSGFPLYLLGAGILGLGCAGYVYWSEHGVPIGVLAPAVILPPLFIYLMNLIYFGAARKRFRDLTHVMTYYGTRAKIDSID
jgi:hypothetical protein